MIKNLETDDIELLNVVIYEEDFKITKNLYDKDKMSYLVETIGRERCLNLLSSPYDDMLLYLLNNEYKIEQHTLEQQLGSGKWRKSNYVRASKKIQKHLELYFLDNIYPDNVEAQNKYNELFGPYTYELGLQKIIDDLYNDKCKSNEENKNYNKDVEYLRRYFEENPDEPCGMEGVKRELKNISKGLISNELTRRVNSHYNTVKFSISQTVELTQKIKELEEELEKLKNNSEELKATGKKVSKKMNEKIIELGGEIKDKQNRIKSFSESCFSSYKILTKLPIRVILSKDDLEEYYIRNKTYYNKIVDELNYIYGYDRYIK